MTATWTSTWRTPAACCLDDADVCVGCGRSLAEIREWGKADDSRRLQIRSQAARRQSLAGRLS
ncbi:DUF1289 domain-containing protein [Pseudomonas aeruginosa]